MSIFRLAQLAASGLDRVPEGAWDLSYLYYDDPLQKNVTTAVTFGSDLIVTTWEANPRSLFIKPDGTTLYVIGDSGDEINQFTLTTPWVISPATYVSTFALSAQGGSPRGLFFSPDGTKAFVSEDANNRVNEYSLSTAWDITTMSYVQNISTTSQDASPFDVNFKPDGTKMYVAGNQNNAIYEYNLSTAWDLSTASYSQSFSAASQTTGLSSVEFSSDGLTMYIISLSGSTFLQYNLGTAWDISTAVYSSSLLVTVSTAALGFFMKETEGFVYVVDSPNDRIYQYTIGGFSVSAQETAPTDVAFSSDGTKMYILGTAGDDVNEYNLSSAWDVSTAVYSTRYDTGTVQTVPQGFYFSPDGTKLYTIGSGIDAICQWSLSTPWSIATTTYVGQFSVAAQANAPMGLTFKPDGTKVYVCQGQIFEYSLSTAWDISTASYAQTASITPSNNPSSISFKDDGKSVYILNSDGVLDEYGLGTAWDISSISYTQEVKLTPSGSNQSGMFFKPDGTKLFAVGYTFDKVFTYSLGVQP